MSRLLYNDLNCSGATPTLGASLTSGGLTITFPAALKSWGTNIATIASPDYLPLTLDPLGDPLSSGVAEVVHLTAYTSGATTGTIVRGQEGSSGEAHANGAPVAHGPAVLDARPSWDMSGAGSPVGTVTPTQKGARYQDLTNGALYEAVGTTSASWIAIGGAGDQTIAGITEQSGAIIILAASTQLELSDVAAFGISGTGNGWSYVPGAADGDQTIVITLGSTGQFTWSFNADGTSTFPGNIAAPVASSQQAAGYIFALTDISTVVEGTSGSAQTFTIPPHSSVAFPVGSTIEVFQDGAGVVTIAAGAGVTIHSPGGLMATNGQYATVGLRCRATDVWVLSGDLG